jgi:hypothetical protein
MPDHRLTGVPCCELHSLNKAMLLGHITLSAFMATCTEGFLEEPCN